MIETDISSADLILCSWEMSMSCDSMLSRLLAYALKFGVTLGTMGSVLSLSKSKWIRV